MSLKDIMTKLGKAGVPLAKVAILAKVPLVDAVSAKETPAKVANLANLPPAARWRVSIEEWHPTAQDMLTLREKALQFFFSKWAERAASAGWSDIDLFGLSANDEGRSISIRNVGARDSSRAQRSQAIPRGDQRRSSHAKDRSRSHAHQTSRHASRNKADVLGVPVMSPAHPPASRFQPHGAPLLHAYSQVTIMQTGLGRAFRRKLHERARQYMHNDGLLWPQAVAKATEELKCGARTLAGGRCQRRGLGAGFRCWRHGGATGPRTEEQRQRQREFAKTQPRERGRWVKSATTTGT